MANLSSLAPFAQKALALSLSHKQTTSLPSASKVSTNAKVNQCEEWALPFVIDADVHWHWENGRESLEHLLKKYNGPAQAAVNPLAFRNERIALPQPFWDLTGDPNEHSLRSEVGTCETAKQAECGAELSPATGDSGRFPEWRMEHLACYFPAHAGDAGRYGIHISEAGVVAVARKVHEGCPEENAEVVLLSVCFFMFAHEQCHAWIEDICSLRDFIEANATNARERRYYHAQQRHDGYILMEEALCNTAALAWLKNFLLPPVGRIPSKMPEFDAHKIIGAFNGWLKNQPPGYRNFADLPDTPVSSPIFIGNIVRLIVEIYNTTLPLERWQDHISYSLMQAAGLFFGCDVKPDASLGAIGGSCMDALWAASVPVYLRD